MWYEPKWRHRIEQLPKIQQMFLLQTSKSTALKKSITTNKRLPLRYEWNSIRSDIDAGSTVNYVPITVRFPISVNIFSLCSKKPSPNIFQFELVRISRAFRENPMVQSYFTGNGSRTQLKTTSWIIILAIRNKILISAIIQSESS